VTVRGFKKRQSPESRWPQAFRETFSLQGIAGSSDSSGHLFNLKSFEKPSAPKALGIETSSEPSFILKSANGAASR